MHANVAADPSWVEEVTALGEKGWVVQMNTKVMDPPIMFFCHELAGFCFLLSSAAKRKQLKGSGRWRRR